MTWNPDQYLRFTDLRSRPGLELIARIDHPGPEVVFDLGCGPGHLTAVLANRWPEAHITGVDSSVEMLERARAQFAAWPNLEWLAADLETWTPPPGDVIYSNAALHWLPNHSVLFPALLDSLKPGGVLAAQMPDNWEEPSHRLIGHLVDRPRWRSRTAARFVRNPVHSPAEYGSWLERGAASIDIWRTTYYHRLEGQTPVLDWVRGSVLTPVLADLSAEERSEFEADLAALYDRAYPPSSDGVTVLAFNRLFIVATRG